MLGIDIYLGTATCWIARNNSFSSSLSPGYVVARTPVRRFECLAIIVILILNHGQKLITPMTSVFSDNAGRYNNSRGPLPVSGS